MQEDNMRHQHRRNQVRCDCLTRVSRRPLLLTWHTDAETSVTIPDVVYVIDTGRVREVRRNKKTSTSMLVTDWCPKSSAKQRQGRAGRVQSGICESFPEHFDPLLHFQQQVFTFPLIASRPQTVFIYNGRERNESSK